MNQEPHLKTKLAFFFSLLFTSTAFAATVNTTRSNIKGGMTVSLDGGLWCYSVFQGGDPKAPTVILEISNSVNDKCDDSLESGLVTKEMSLSIVDRERRFEAKSLYDVRPLSTLRLLSATADGSTNQWPLLRMKKGTVKFFNESKGFGRYATDPYAEDTGVQLQLPVELQKVLEESGRDAEHVAVVLREIQDAKKSVLSIIR